VSLDSNDKAHGRRGQNLGESLSFPNGVVYIAEQVMELKRCVLLVFYIGGG